VPTGAAVLGATAPSTRVVVDVALRPRDPAALAELARAVSTPGDPRYHRYLPAGRLAADFGPTPATLQRTRQWLASTGLSVGTTSADGLLIAVAGSAAQIESAFAVPLVQARLTDGRTVRLATREPGVPASLAPEFQGILGLSDQAVAAPHLAGPTPLTAGPGLPTSLVGAHGAGPQPCPAISGHGQFRTATDLAATYGLSPLYAAGRTGAGQTVGLFEMEGYAASDIAAYQACYGLAVPVATTLVDGGALPDTVPHGEAALDIEVVAGLAPGASIRVYTGPNDGANGPIDTYSRMVSDDAAKVLSTSWGQCESQMGANTAQAEAAQLAEQTVFQLAAVQGQTVVAASGDAGSSDCYHFPDDLNTAAAVDDPAAQPFVTGVGGTILSGVAPDAPSEVAWGGAASSGGAGGGGNSTTFAAPAWQTVSSGLSTHTCGPTSQALCREVPDVSASADPAYGDLIYFQGQWNVFGGTSVAAPLWGAVVATTDQGCASTAGLLNPALYGPGTTGAFNDVTAGDNSLPGLAPGVTTTFPATVGYDQATGWGSPRAVALLGLLTGAGSGCPTVTGLVPSSGPAIGGTTVVVSGSGFGSTVPTVAFGGVPATVTAWSPLGTSVTVTAPPGSAGPVAVTVTNAGTAAGGTSPATPVSTFTYLAPQVARVTPDKGPTPGGGTVVVSGSRFIDVHSVTFGGTPANFTVDSLASLRATVPPGVGGTVDVIVTGSEGASRPTPTDRYTYATPGYWMVAADGGIFAYGNAGFFGTASTLALDAPIVSMAPTPDDRGYWLASTRGGVFSYGDAGFFGSMGGQVLNRPIVAITATADGGGYWLVASDGGVFAYGDAGYYGSTGNIVLNRPVVGLAASPDGGGYWLVAADGGIFAYGDAAFYGSTGAQLLNKPIVGMSVDVTGGGYWLVAADGGIFAYGDAAFYGSTGAQLLNKPIVGMSVDLTGDGYWLVASDGGIFAFGSAPFYGSTGDMRLNRPITGMAAT
jgi:hypothetical protein